MIKFPAIALIIMLLTLNLSAQKMQTDNTLKKRVKQIFEYTNTQNWDALRATMADTMKMYSLFGAVMMDNPDGLIIYFKGNYSKYPKEHATIEKLIIMGNKAIVKEKITGHETGVPIYDVLLFEFKENKIAAAWIIFNQ